MELREYLHVARRHWLLIIATIAVSVAVAVTITNHATKQYASTARIFVSTSPSTSADAYQGGLFSELRVTSYVDLLTGLELSQRVIDQLGLHLTPQQLASRITASVVPDTVVLRVSVTDPDPAQAQRINEGVVSQLQAFVAELETPPGKTVPLLKATVVDPPDLNTNAVSPRPLRNTALGLLIGLLLGLALALLREVLDNSVRHLSDVSALSDTPLLASFAYDSEVRRQPLISSLDAQAPRSEAYRILRTNLSFLDVDAASKVFVVTSSVPGEGKSTTAINAAIALASAGERVLLIDADLRRPRAATLLGLEGSVGLTTVLVGASKLDEVVQVHAQSGLHVLTAGRVPPNPAELLQSRAMHDLLQEARSSYQHTIIDAPPLLPVTDAALLTSQAEGAVLVVRHSKTTKDQVSGAVARLASVGAVPLGVVFNMTPPGRTRGYYGYYGYYGYAREGEPGSGRRGPRLPQRLRPARLRS